MRETHIIGYVTNNGTVYIINRYFALNDVALKINEDHDAD